MMRASWRLRLVRTKDPCTRAGTVQASFNRLTSLPKGMGALPKLELLRVAVNNIGALPPEFAGLDRLAWLSLASNPVCPAALPARCSCRRQNRRALTADIGVGRKGPEHVSRSLCRQLAALQSGRRCHYNTVLSRAGRSSVSKACLLTCCLRSEIADIQMDEVELGPALGDGASGDVFAACYRGSDAALKVFKSEVSWALLMAGVRLPAATWCDRRWVQPFFVHDGMNKASKISRSLLEPLSAACLQVSPDGRAADEIAVTCFVDHPNLIKVLGLMQKPHGLLIGKVGRKRCP